jgi:hypothetical protein
VKPDQKEKDKRDKALGPNATGIPVAAMMTKMS